MVALQALIRSIAELHQIRLHCPHAVALNTVVACNCLGNAHASRDVNAEDDRDVLWLALELLIMNLSRSFHNESNGFSLRQLFRLELHSVLRQAKLANPELQGNVAFLHLLDLTVFVEYGLALGTEDRISRSQLAAIFKAAHRNLKHVSIYLLAILAGLLPLALLLQRSNQGGA
jgi:hypothetical protein